MRINPINGMKKASSPMNGTHAHPQIIEIKHLKVDGQIKAIRYTLTITHSVTHRRARVHRIQYA